MILFSRPESPLLLILLLFNIKKYMKLTNTMKILIVLMLFYLQYNPLEPQLWKPSFKLPYLNDKNNILKNTILYEKGIILAPESLAIDIYDKDHNIYASLADGRVVLISKEGKYINTIYFNKRYITSEQSILDDSLSEQCTQKAISHDLAWDKMKERECGRPLGLRIKKIKGKKYLFIVDAYNGIFVIDFSLQNVEHIITPNTTIYPNTATNNRTPKFYNDLDVSLDDGTIYFTDSSFKNTRSENRIEVLDAAPRGRLFSFKSKKFGGDDLLHVIICGLHFPNGVQLGSNSHELMVVESARFRVLKLNLNDKIFNKKNETLIASCDEYGSLYQYLDQNKQGGVQVLLDAAPGFMDNIRKGQKESQYLIGVGAKSAKPFSLLYLVYQSLILRNIVGRIIPMRYIEYLVPKYGLVLVIDSNNGKIIKTYQDPSGKIISSISEAQIHPTGDLLLGSHSNPYLGILKKQYYD